MTEKELIVGIGIIICSVMLAYLAYWDMPCSSKGRCKMDGKGFNKAPDHFDPMHASTVIGVAERRKYHIAIKTGGPVQAFVKGDCIRITGSSDEGFHIGVSNLGSAYDWYTVQGRVDFAILGDDGSTVGLKAVAERIDLTKGVHAEEMAEVLGMIVAERAAGQEVVE